MKKKEKEDVLPGLTQSILTHDNKHVVLKDLLVSSDVWKLDKRGSTAIIISHNGVKKIADAAGISTNVDYQILTQPKYDNNYQYLIQCKICDNNGKCTVELGESNRNNLGSRGKNNPANMAQKRAYDRAVLRHVGIEGLLSEDELPDQDEYMNDSLQPEEMQAIAPLINKILAAKSKTDLTAFNNLMKKEASKYNEKQLEKLRTVYKNKLNSFVKTF